MLGIGNYLEQNNLKPEQKIALLRHDLTFGKTAFDQDKVQGIY